MALLRIVGASRIQVFRLVLVEAVLVGLLSAVLGVVVGAGLTFAVLALVSVWLGFAIPTGGLIITFWSLVMIFTLGITSSVGASILPAFKTCRWPPLAALTDFTQIKTQNLLWRSLIGALRFWWGPVWGLDFSQSRFGLDLVDAVDYGDADRCYHADTLPGAPV